MAKAALRPPLRPAPREQPYHPKNIGGSTGSGFLRGRFCVDFYASRKSRSEGSRVKRLIEQAEKQMAGK